MVEGNSLLDNRITGYKCCDKEEVYENDERGYHMDMLKTKSEDEAFDFMYKYVSRIDFCKSGH